ncbi:MAG TPA: hypothetical protein VMM58_11495, partial [Bacteroidota bacterium]|nr:hypothetical protein [Bacteroidota bacterium]
MGIFSNLALDIIGSVIAAVIGWMFSKWIKNRIVNRKILHEQNRLLIAIGYEFYKEGLTKFHFSRDDYGRT